MAGKEREESKEGEKEGGKEGGRELNQIALGNLFKVVVWEIVKAILMPLGRYFRFDM